MVCNIVMVVEMLKISLTPLLLMIIKENDIGFINLSLRQFHAIPKALTI